MIYWLNLAPEIFAKPEAKKPENNPNKNNPEDSFFNKKRKAFIDIANNPESKSVFVKSLAVIFGCSIFYFIFIHGRVTNLHISSITCPSTGTENLIKFTAHDHSTDVQVDTKKLHKNTYSEPQGQHGNATVHKIYTYSKNYGSISFNISATSLTTGGQSFSLDSGCELFWKNNTSTSTNCCCKNGSTDSTSACCNSGTTTCTCSGSSNNCSCCELSKLIKFALNNPNPQNRPTVTKVFFSLLPTLLYLGVFIFLMRSTLKAQTGFYGKNSIFKIGKSLSDTVKSKITFKDVAGIQEEKFELEEIVDYLKHPQKYNSMGARTPKGVILYGPPGTGKTLLAKAVSGEADVPFLEASGASFDDMFVGVGAKRVRELFAKAKKLSPCIIFIDEIDALASKRGSKFSSGSGNDQTINQLLSEMDGFNTQAGIVVIAATNRLKHLDDAVLRPGRFDRHIRVGLPNILERKEIVALHAKNKNVAASVDLGDIARKTPGFSGAQLENVLNESALLAVRNNKNVIGNIEINEAIDRVMAGPAKRNKFIDFKDKKQIAYHESGHAIAGLYANEGDVVEKITIIPRGDAAGYVLSAPEKQESIIKTKQQLLSTLITTLAGRAAEEIFFGEEKISSGASNDLYKATNVARTMVVKLGMSKVVGLVQHQSSEDPENPYKNTYSEHSAQIIDIEIQKILTEQYMKAKQIIEENKHEFLLIVETLLLLETIDKTQIDYIHKYKKIPALAIKEKNELLKKEMKDQLYQMKEEE